MQGRGSSALLLAVVALLIATAGAYFFPAGSEYLSARSKELAAAARGRKAKREAVAPSKAHDILDSLPEFVDSRIAGWRVKQPAQQAGEEKGAEAAGEPVLVDTHKQSHLPAVGDVVEYVLPPHLLLDDGRTKGLGVLLSINRDRLDAGTLPESKLDLCQIDPLTLDVEAEGHAEGSGAEGQEEAAAGVGQVWKKDELEPRHFAPYKELKKVRAKHNGKADRWQRWALEEALSEGCGPPAGAEDVLEIL